ncbi:MAG: leucine-rich repeat domain-containing protein, partial [Cyanobacteria bacterium J06641_2]
LNVSSNQISDVEPISKLTNLTRLNLSKNKISDPQPLSQLTKLEIRGLNLWKNPISNKTCPVKPEYTCLF